MDNSMSNKSLMTENVQQEGIQKEIRKAGAPSSRDAEIVDYIRLKFTCNGYSYSG